jgi:hypothetical protein
MIRFPSDQFGFLGFGHQWKLVWDLTVSGC